MRVHRNVDNLPLKRRHATPIATAATTACKKKQNGLTEYNIIRDYKMGEITIKANFTATVMSGNSRGGHQNIMLSCTRIIFVVSIGRRCRCKRPSVKSMQLFCSIPTRYEHIVGHSDPSFTVWSCHTVFKCSTSRNDHARIYKLHTTSTHSIENEVIHFRYRYFCQLLHLISATANAFLSHINVTYSRPSLPVSPAARRSRKRPWFWSWCGCYKLSCLIFQTCSTTNCQEPPCDWSVIRVSMQRHVKLTDTKKK